MVNYKLTYFDVRGLGEVTRQLFHLGGVAFEDERIPMGSPEWEKLKTKTPFGQLPVLSVDGFQIPQSAAINRYLARKFKLAGKTAEEEAWVDAIVDLFKDFIETGFKPMIIATQQKKSVDEIEKIKKEKTIPARDSFFKNLTGVLEKSKSGYLVGSSLTFGDLVVTECLVTLENNGLFKKTEFPKLATFQKKVHGSPKLKEYLASRPNSQM